MKHLYDKNHMAAQRQTLFYRFVAKHPTQRLNDLGGWFSEQQSDFCHYQQNFHNNINTHPVNKNKYNKIQIKWINVKNTHNNKSTLTNKQAKNESLKKLEM